MGETASRRAESHLQTHGEWRPEWQTGRVALCWYLVFDDELMTLLGPGGLEAVRRTEWLDAVPARWLHVTLCDVGFADMLTPTDVQRVLAEGRHGVEDLPRLSIGFGPAAPMEDAIALPVEPPEPVRHLQRRMLSATERALSPSRGRAPHTLYLPHLSLGYANRWVSAVEAAGLVERIGEVSGEVMLDRLVLAAVMRQRTHYEWSVVAEVALAPGERDTHARHRRAPQTHEVGRAD